MTFAKITKDLLFTPDDADMGLTNRTGEVLVGDPSTHTYHPKHDLFRLLDDDRIPYFEGWADNDGMEFALEWGMRDSGATILQVRKDGRWVDHMN